MKTMKMLAISSAYLAVTIGSIAFANIASNTEVNAEIVEQTRPEVLDYSKLNIVMPCEMVHEEQTNPLFTVDGQMLNEDIQKYIYNHMKEWGCESYYQFWLAEIYQESRFKHDAVSASGLDYGFCQLRITYHQYFCELAGHPEFDVINDYWANLYVGTYIWCKNLKESGYDLSATIMMYYNSGNTEADLKYLADVTQWFSTIERK